MVVCVFALLALPLQAARVVSVTLCEDVVKPDMVPVNIRTRFTTDAPALHALAVLEELRPGSKIKGVWVSVDAISTPNYEIDSAEVVAQGANATAHFVLSRPQRGWPVGNYKLNVYLDGKLVSVTTFSIVAATPAAPEAKPRQPDPLFEREAPARPAPAPSAAESAGGFSGTYVLENQGTKLTLVMRQDAQGGISGRLTSSTGVTFELEGQVEEGEAIGICSGDQTKVYFQAQRQGNQLLLALIEPGANNMPDYNRARQLTFTRQGGGAPAERSGLPSRGFGAEPAAPSRQAAEEPAAANEVGDPSWGFRFRVPAGWKEKHDAGGAILGHDTIAGVIFVLPHMAANLQEVQQQMLQGISEEGLQLRPSGSLQKLGDIGVAGDYEGIAQQQRVRARGIGVASPRGGGAYILAVAMPDKYTRELAAAAEAVAAGMRYSAPEVSEVAQFFAGTWETMTTNTMTSYTLFPDGTFTGNYEASYSGNRVGGVNPWGLARQDQQKGRWTVRGTRESGVLVLRYPDGRQETVNYRVHVEKGETYWNEYLFDGVLYGKKR